jgi:hypothetical protein
VCYSIFLYPIGITVTILAAFPASLEKRNSTAVARGALAVTGAFVPIASLTLGQGKAAEEYKAQNGNLHLGIFLGMEATNAEMKNTKIIISICN